MFEFSQERAIFRNLSFASLSITFVPVCNLLLLNLLLQGLDVRPLWAQTVLIDQLPPSITDLRATDLRATGSEAFSELTSSDIAGSGITNSDLTGSDINLEAISTQANDLIEPVGLLAQLEPDIEAPQETELQKSETVEGQGVPPGAGETIVEIQVRYVDRAGQPTEGHTQPEIITREFELQPGDIYDPELAQQGLDRVIGLTAIQTASLSLEPTADPTQAILVVNLREAAAIGLVLGNEVTPPSVLRGITLPEPVRTSPARIDGVQIPASLQWRNIGGQDQSLTFGILGGNEADGLDLTFAAPWLLGTDHLGYAININGLGYLNPTFNAGDESVELPNGNADFWERRIGGGIQVVQRPTPDLAWAAGLSYQQISMREALTGGRLFREDEFGNALVLSDDGIDSLLTLNATLVLDHRNDLNFPTAGSRLQFGLDQAIPVGDASILYTRPMVNFTQFWPLSFIEVDQTPSTLLFNFQGGTILGDAPPYEAFVLGGSSSIRGYGTGEVASPQTFAQASLEYRIPFAVLKSGPGLLQETLGERILFAGNLFADYGTGFGTQALITGEPGVVRDKPGEGFGFGLGLLATSNFGLARFELGISDQGDVAFYFTIGDRF